MFRFLQATKSERIIFLQVSNIRCFIRPVNIKVDRMVKCSMLIRPIQVNEDDPPTISTFLQRSTFNVRVITDLIRRSRVADVITCRERIIMERLRSSQVEVKSLQFTFPTFNNSGSSSINNSHAVGDYKNDIFRCKSTFSIIKIRVIRTPFSAIRRSR